MTEQQWLRCDDPTRLLAACHRRAGSERRYELFAAACCRRVWRLLSDQRLQWGIELAEQEADGFADPRLARVKDEMQRRQLVPGTDAKSVATNVAARVLRGRSPGTALFVAREVARAVW